MCAERSTRERGRRGFSWRSVVERPRAAQSTQPPQFCPTMSPTVRQPLTFEKSHPVEDSSTSFSASAAALAAAFASAARACVSSRATLVRSVWLRLSSSFAASTAAFCSATCATSAASASSSCSRDVVARSSRTSARRRSFASLERSLLPSGAAAARRTPCRGTRVDVRCRHAAIGAAPWNASTSVTAEAAQSANMALISNRLEVSPLCATRLRAGFPRDPQATSDTSGGGAAVRARGPGRQNETSASTHSRSVRA